MIIFDWDGTLCDSVEHIVTAMTAAAVSLDIEAPSAAQVRDIVGLGLPQAVAQLFPDEAERARVAMAAAYAEHFVAAETELGAGPQLFPGVLETLHTLRERGLELAVATGKSRRGLDRVLARLELSEFFDASRCADETRSKPDPLMLHELMGERGVSASQVVMVGDSEYDLEMACRAGVRSVGVSFGVHSPQRLAQHGPIAIVDTLPQLLELDLV